MLVKDQKKSKKLLKDSSQRLPLLIEKEKKRQKEMNLLLKGTRAVLENKDFTTTAQRIFNYCKDVTGATSGYVAMLSKDGSENEVLFLDTGNYSCAVNPALPMPIRGLREVAYKRGEVVYDNDFANSKWMKFMPEGHVGLRNVMFAPLMLNKKAVGLLGLGNKDGNFNRHDARMAKTFSEFAAIALANSRSLELLEESENRFRSVINTAKDAMIIINGSGYILFWNDEAAAMFGHTAKEAVGRSLTIIMPERFKWKHSTAVMKASTKGKLSREIKSVELSGLRKNGEEFPLELSIGAWNSNEGPLFAGIMRDISARKKAEDELKKAKSSLELKVKERTSELVIANKRLQKEIAGHKEAAKQLKASLTEKELLLREVHHRVKNNMEVISNLIEFQTEKIKDSKYLRMFKECQHRINAMELIHKRLYKAENLAKINFGEYMKSLVGELFSFYKVNSDKIELKMDISDIFLNIETAIPCGLIINEIVSNSLQYAFPKGEKGEIDIELRTLKNGKNELIISDNGVGIPEEFNYRESSSLGLKLIVNLAEYQLNGKIKLAKKKGTKFIFRFNEAQYKERLRSV